MNLSLPAFPIPWDNFSTVIQKESWTPPFEQRHLFCRQRGPLHSVCSRGRLCAVRNRTKLNSFLYIFIVLGITMPMNYVAP